MTDIHPNGYNAVKNQPNSTIKQEEIHQHLSRLLEELNKGLYDKERTIRLTLLAVLAGESTFMLGEPGTAKSLIARRVADAFGIEKKEFFSYLMNQFSQPDEVFGPVSIQKLKNDEYERKTESYLPKAKFAFLDEIWKANPAIQNSLLTILNEREFRNNGKNEKVDLIGFISASNELPAQNQGLEAIFDRFLVRILEKSISKDSDNFRKMISDVNELSKITEKISLEEIQTIVNGAKKVKLSDECYDIIVRVAKATSEENENIADEEDKWLISDRRWKKIVNLMRVSAYCNGRTETDIMDASLIADCIWRNETQEEDAKRIVKDAIENYGMKCTTDLHELKQSLEKFFRTLIKKFYEEKYEGGDFKTEVINNRKYYAVKDSNNNTHHISADKCYSYSSEYYLDNSNKTIYGQWDCDTGIFTEHYHKDKYTIEKNPIRQSYGFTKAYSKDPEALQLIVDQFTDSEFNPLWRKVLDAFESIKNQMQECKNNLGGNIFTDNKAYLPVINTKLTDSKMKTEQILDYLSKLQQCYKNKKDFPIFTIIDGNSGAVINANYFGKKVDITKKIFTKPTNPSEDPLKVELVLNTKQKES